MTDHYRRNPNVYTLIDQREDKPPTVYVHDIDHWVYRTAVYRPWQPVRWWQFRRRYYLFDAERRYKRAEKKKPWSGYQLW